MKAAAIIVAAGSGRRFRSATPKQFLPLKGRAMFLWSVQAFRALPAFTQVIVVVPAERMRALASLQKKYGFDIVSGGKERIDSVRAGLAAVRPEIGYVAIHDAARPLVPAGTIEHALRAARAHGAAVVAVPARDTVKISVSGRWVDRTANRAHIWLAQTPQVFRRKLIDGAYARLTTGSAITDDSQVAEAAGIRVRIVPGTAANMKVTEPGDLAIAALLLRKASV